ncbi:unnamed protein product [Arctia plantaginis]|uniref:Calreticulin n=1 Tax=Arctia plantaginis TaxID=874455 RepID=A0A8S1AGG8_ARCPL|nr:unnamed protein product [Arctia plantaginis]
MNALVLAVVSSLALASINCEVFFEEKFLADSWENEWVYSEHRGKEFGKFKLTVGKFFDDCNEDKGQQTGHAQCYYGTVCRRVLVFIVQLIYI